MSPCEISPQRTQAFKKIYRELRPLHTETKLFDFQTSQITPEVTKYKFNREDTSWKMGKRLLILFQG